VDIGCFSYKTTGSMLKDYHQANSCQKYLHANHFEEEFLSALAFDVHVAQQPSGFSIGSCPYLLEHVLHPSKHNSIAIFSGPYDHPFVEHYNKCFKR